MEKSLQISKRIGGTCKHIIGRSSNEEINTTPLYASKSEVIDLLPVRSFTQMQIYHKIAICDEQTLYREVYSLEAFSSKWMIDIDVRYLKAAVDMKSVEEKGFKIYTNDLFSVGIAMLKNIFMQNLKDLGITVEKSYIDGPENIKHFSEVIFKKTDDCLVGMKYVYHNFWLQQHTALCQIIIDHIIPKCIENNAVSRDYLQEFINFFYKPLTYYAKNSSTLDECRFNPKLYLPHSDACPTWLANSYAEVLYGAETDVTKNIALIEQKMLYLCKCYCAISGDYTSNLSNRIIQLADIKHQQSSSNSDREYKISDVSLYDELDCIKKSFLREALLDKMFHDNEIQLDTEKNSNIDLFQRYTGTIKGRQTIACP